ncbi:MAG: TadE/TadG family type IV pilus assembly protein [Actinomycetes bacterium]
MQELTDERGTSLVEAAFVLPVLVAVVLGVMEFGLVFASTSTATQASRSGARLAAVQYAAAGTAPTAQRSATDAVAAAVAADLAGLGGATPVGIAVYRVDPLSTSGLPVGGAPGAGLLGGCTDRCVRYRWTGSALEYANGSWSDPDACGTSVDSIGVYVQVDHRYVTGLLGSTRTVTGATVMRLEPLATDQCTP